MDWWLSVHICLILRDINCNHTDGKMYLPAFIVAQVRLGTYVQIFAEYEESFIELIRKRSLLVIGKYLVRLDSHKAHLYNLLYINTLNNYINVGSFLAHCTHLVQPLGDVPYASLKQYHQQLTEFNLHK